MKLMQDALSILLSQAIEGMSVREAALKCRVPAHRLRDIIYRKVQRPDAEVLQAISVGLGIPYPRLALAAYGIIADAPGVPEDRSDTSSLENGTPADDDREHQWRQSGVPSRRAIAST